MIGGKFRIAYAVTTILYLISGALAIAANSLLTQMCTNDNILKLLFGPTLLQLILAAGIVVIISTVFGVASTIHTVKRRKTLYAYGITIMIAALLEMISGAILWFQSLQMRALFDSRWQIMFSSADIAKYQDDHKCCGFLDPRDRAVDSAFCPAQNAASSLNVGCKESISKAGTGSLEFVYTILFGFVIVDVLAFLSCIILGQMRKDEERFRRIDQKGNQGMVKPSV